MHGEIFDMGEDRFWEALGRIERAIGGLESAMQSSISQRTALSAKLDTLAEEVSEMRGEFKANAQAEEKLAEEVSAIRREIDEDVKPVTSMFKDAKTKAMVVLAFIALLGGSAGSQAEKIIAVFLGRGG